VRFLGLVYESSDTHASENQQLTRENFQKLSKEIFNTKRSVKIRLPESRQAEVLGLQDMGEERGLKRAGWWRNEK